MISPAFTPSRRPAPARGSHEWLRRDHVAWRLAEDHVAGMCAIAKRARAHGRTFRVPGFRFVDLCAAYGCGSEVDVDGCAEHPDADIVTELRAVKSPDRVGLTQDHRDEVRAWLERCEAERGWLTTTEQAVLAACERSCDAAEDMVAAAWNALHRTGV